MVVKVANEKIRKRRGPKKVPTQEDNFMDTLAAQTTKTVNFDKDPDFPNEWISIAAYYIWKNDGEPEGRDAYYWERAKTELRQLQKDGNLPTALDPLDEER